MEISAFYEAMPIISKLKDVENLLKSRDDIQIKVSHDRGSTDELRLTLSPDTLEAIEMKKKEIRDLIISGLTKVADKLKTQLAEL